MGGTSEPSESTYMWCAEAEECFIRALALDPNNSVALGGYALWYAHRIYGCDVLRPMRAFVCARERNARRAHTNSIC